MTSFHEELVGNTQLENPSEPVLVYGISLSKPHDLVELKYVNIGEVLTLKIQRPYWYYYDKL